MAGTPQQIKLVVIGDGAVGKTCLLWVYAKKTFPTEYVPTVFDNFTTEMTMDNKKISLGLWDTAGQEEFDQIRPLSYPGTSVFLICFAVTNYNSYENIKSKWNPELAHHAPTVPKILVGTKIDLRDEVKNKGDKVVTAEDGEELRKEITAVKYIECSAKTQQNLNTVFEESIKIVLQQTSKKSKKKDCIIL